MDEALAAQVFEPFFTTKDVGQGTGLGLSQVHGFCTQAGGCARLASTPGLGTTVTLVLPAQADAPAATETPPGPAAPDVAQPELLSGARVLLVEDNDELADVTAMLLESYGASVQRARHVDEALLRHEADPGINLVLTDVVMPGGRNGIDLAHELRRRRPELPIVLISGYSAALAGATEFPVLNKPVAARQLVETLAGAWHGPGA